MISAVDQVIAAFCKVLKINNNKNSLKNWRFSFSVANQASQQAANGDENPLNSVLRQTLAASNLTQQLQQAQVLPND